MNLALNTKNFKGTLPNGDRYRIMIEDRNGLAKEYRVMRIVKQIYSEWLESYVYDGCVYSFYAKDYKSELRKNLIKAEKKFDIKLTKSLIKKSV